MGGKVGLFVHKGHRGEGASKEAWEKAKNDKIILLNEYENKARFKNTATHIDPELLEYYFDHHCGSRTASL